MQRFVKMRPFIVARAAWTIHPQTMDTLSPELVLYRLWPRSKPHDGAVHYELDLGRYIRNQNDL